MTLGTANAEGVALRRLQTFAANIAPADLGAEITVAARLLRAELPSLPDYPELDEDHQAYYDLAVGLTAAMSLLAPAIAAANDGIAKLKTPDYEYTFAVPDPAERGRWAEEVARAVGYLVKLVRNAQPAPRPRRQFHMFGAAGVARQRERHWKRGADVVRLLIPDGWVYGSWFGADVCGLGEISGLGEV